MLNLVYIVFRIVFIYFSFFNTSSESTIEPDYYWRVYTGTIPADAIEGGISSGNTTYIGLITIPHISGLLPAIIYQNKKAATASVHRKSFEDDRFVLILCSQHKEKLKWITTNIRNFPTSIAVKAGNENDGKRKIYIGRAHFGNDLIIGKVFEGQCNGCGIWFPNYEGKEVHYRHFDVLTYEPGAGIIIY